MDNKKENSNIVLALLISMLTSLAGGLVFGLIYGVGYYIYFLALAEIILSTNTFFKFYKKRSKGTTFLAILWGIIWTFVFNFLAIIICEAIWVANELNTSFINGYSEVIRLWRVDSDVQAYLNVRMFQILGMIILGGIVYGIYYIVNKSKLKNQNQNNQKQDNQKTSTNNNQSVQPKLDDNTKVETKPVGSTDKKININEIYLPIFAESKSKIVALAKTKDQEQFKKDMKDIKVSKIEVLDTNTKEALKDLINKLLTRDNMSQIDKKTNEALLKILK